MAEIVYENLYEITNKTLQKQLCMSVSCRDASMRRQRIQNEQPRMTFSYAERGGHLEWSQTLLQLGRTMSTSVIMETLNTGGTQRVPISYSRMGSKPSKRDSTNSYTIWHTWSGHGLLRHSHIINACESLDILEHENAECVNYIF